MTHMTKMQDAYDRRYMDDEHLERLAEIWAPNLVLSVKGRPGPYHRMKANGQWADVTPKWYRDEEVEIVWNFERGVERVTRREFETLMRGACIWREMQRLGAHFEMTRNG